MSLIRRSKGLLSTSASLNSERSLRFSKACRRSNPGRLRIIGKMREWKVRTRSRASFCDSARPQVANSAISLLMKSLRDSRVNVTTVNESSSNPR
ncbi:hypothetical protein D3C78_1471260 [compost metagenome]